MGDLQGKAALITGASRGIGAATARVLADQGVAVVLLARSGAEINSLAEEIRRKGGRALAVTGDVTCWSDLEAAVGQCTRQFGSIDILVNNAGVILPIALIGDSDPTAWSEVVDINLKGVYYGYRAALPQMLLQGEGVIINISSGAARFPLEGWSHYCATKAGMYALTTCGHLEYADKGIRVIGLSPGTVATEMQVLIRASGVNPVSQMDPSVHRPVEIVGRAVAYLCTPAAAAFAGTDVDLNDPQVQQQMGLGDPDQVPGRQ
ncbi:MAG: SDR family NAD(P)-dependent oxidoreductase [Pseudomonadota bacterium]